MILFIIKKTCNLQDLHHQTFIDFFTFQIALTVAFVIVVVVVGTVQSSTNGIVGTVQSSTNGRYSTTNGIVLSLFVCYDISRYRCPLWPCLMDKCYLLAQCYYLLLSANLLELNKIPFTYWGEHTRSELV